MQNAVPRLYHAGSMSSAWCFVCFAFTVAVGCGDVTVEQPTGTGGAGASGGGDIGGGGGGLGGAGGADSSCSAIGSTPCPTDSFCSTPDGQCDAPGQCLPKPDGCFTDCTGVCGCDGNFYCNACEANAAGVGVSGETDCQPDEVVYRARLWLGGLDHLVLMKQNLTHDTCVRLFADWPTAPGTYPDVTAPDGWGVNQIEAWPSSAGCLEDEASPPPGAVSASEAHGSIDWIIEAGMFYPCFLDASVSVAFDDPPPEVLATESLLAARLPVDGGCL